MTPTRGAAFRTGLLILVGGLCLRAAERLLRLPSGTLAAARAEVGERPDEIAAWREATDRLVARAEAARDGR